MASDDSALPGDPQAPPAAGNGSAPDETVFGHFHVHRRPDGTLAELGRGAMGVTYRAFDTSLQTEVALKVIRPEHVAEDSARRRFQREARAAARIRHPNVATVIYLGEQGGEFYYAMEFLAGRSLDDYLKERGTALPPREAVALAAQAAAGLNAAHRQEVVHRDLKPSNLMLLEGAALDHTDERTRAGGNRLLKLIDFGLARSFGVERHDQSLVTQTLSGFIGTPAYASPEQGAGADDLDGRADLYSLGVILWQMLCGQLPFSGRVIEVLGKHQLQPPPFEQLAGVPPPLVALLKGLLEKNPAARRPQTAGELRDLLDEFLRDPSGLVVRAVPDRVRIAPQEPRPPTQIPTPLPDGARRSPAPLPSRPADVESTFAPPPPLASVHQPPKRPSILPAICMVLCLLVGAGGVLVWNLRAPPGVVAVPPSPPPPPAASPPVVVEVQPTASPVIAVTPPPTAPDVVVVTPSPSMPPAMHAPVATPRAETARTSITFAPTPRQDATERAPVPRETADPTEQKRQALARAREADRAMTVVYTAGRARLDTNGKNFWKDRQNEWLRARSAQTGGPEMLSRGMSAELGDMRRYAAMDEERTEYLRNNMVPRF